MPMEEPEYGEELVALNNVHKTYLLGVEGVPAVRGVSLSIRRGEFVVLFGTSGGGKTSLLNLMGTIDKPTKGEIMLCGDWVKPTTPDLVLAEKRLNRIGFVFQTFNLLSTMTAIENVELPMILAGVLSPAQRKARATELLTRVGMGERLDHLPSQLSGGEQQRVTIARALANEPELLLLDEPTGDLDSRNTEIVLKTLMDLNLQDKITMIMVTHDVNLKGFANRIVWMRDGRVHRVEHVPISERMDNMSVLNDKLAPREAKKEEDGEGNQVVTFDNTDFRLPSDYPQLVFKRAAKGVATVKTGSHKQEVFTEDAYFGKSNSLMTGGISVPGESVPVAAPKKRRSTSKGRRSNSASRRSAGKKTGETPVPAPAAPAISPAAVETYLSTVTGKAPLEPGKLVTNSNLDALEASIVDLERRSMAHQTKAPSADDAANLVSSVATLRGELAQKEMEAAHRRRKAGGAKDGRVVEDEKAPSAPSAEDSKLAELRRRLAVVEEETSNLQVVGDAQPAKEA